MSENEKLPLYESTPTAVVSTRLPLPLKMKLMELAMKYKMTQGEYMAYMTMKILSDPNAFDPKRIDDLKNEARVSKDQFLSTQNELRKYSEAYEKLKRVSAGNDKTLKQLQSRVSELESELEAARKEGRTTSDHLVKKQDTITKRARESVSKATEQINQLQGQVNTLSERLTKANARLKDEGIGAGLFGGKAVQF